MYSYFYFSISPAILYAVVTLGGLAMIWVTLCYVYRYVRVGSSTCTCTLCTVEDDGHTSCLWVKIVKIANASLLYRALINSCKRHVGLLRALTRCVYVYDSIISLVHTTIHLHVHVHVNVLYVVHGTCTSYDDS